MMNWLILTLAIYTPSGHLTWGAIEPSHPARAAAYRYVAEQCGDTITPEEFVQLPVTFAHLDADDRTDAYFIAGTGTMSSFGCDLDMGYVILRSGSGFQPESRDVPPQAFAQRIEERSSASTDSNTEAGADGSSVGAPDGELFQATDAQNPQPIIEEQAPKPEQGIPDQDETQSGPLLETEGPLRWIIFGVAVTILAIGIIFQRLRAPKDHHQRQSVFHQRYFTGKGRANRREYLASLILSVIAPTAIALAGTIIVPSAGGQVDEETAQLIFAFCAIVFVAILASAISRRLHDLGFSGWFVPLTILPVTAPLVLPALLFLPGEPGANQYGVDPSMARRTNEDRARQRFQEEEGRIRNQSEGSETEPTDVL